MLALYLLLLSFLTLSFAIKAGPLYKKILYLLALSIFLFTILLTYSRAAYLGLFVGSLWFFFAFPKRMVLLKVFAGIVLILALFTVYYVNTQPQLPDFVQQNKTLREIAGRFSVERALQNPRISGWKVSWEALKDRPLLGYGPENFSIGFDKYYDPSLPGIEKMPGSADNWWVRAHNFVFDISLTAGIPALIIFLALLGVLLWQLQKIKNTENELISHGIQATFIAYLVANFFSFDTFSIYLILFLLIGYSLYLIKQTEAEEAPTKLMEVQLPSAITLALFVLLIWFVWVFNIKPFQINSQINIAGLLAKDGFCDQAVETMEKILPQKSFLDYYLRSNYIKVINRCVEQKSLTYTKLLTEKMVKVLEEAVKIRPYYTRIWILLGQYNNFLIENWQENREKEARAALEKALELSPKRQETLQELIKTDILTQKYQQAKEKSEECINLNEKLPDCWWLAGLSYVYLNDLEKADYYIQIATEKGYTIDSIKSWMQLTQAYIEIKNYPRLVEAYSELIKLEPDNAQYYASLAFVYKELGQIEEAKKQALKIIELFPDHQKEAEEFLKTLQ